MEVNKEKRGEREVLETGKTKTSDSRTESDYKTFENIVVDKHLPIKSIRKLPVEFEGSSIRGNKAKVCFSLFIICILIKKSYHSIT